MAGHSRCLWQETSGVVELTGEAVRNVEGTLARWLEKPFERLSQQSRLSVTNAVRAAKQVKLRRRVVPHFHRLDTAVRT